ncbi:hypothetical protein PG997_000814 [Apiospora hydei]|uniref:Uncharacterized protein n=1 Tax=Apiospora hydei TaxID=1337664 RepID=A0ABR1XC05_9PEZI
MQREREREREQQQQTPEENGEENDSIHELINQGALMGSLRSATPLLAVRDTFVDDRAWIALLSRISSRSSVRSSFGDIQVRRVVVMRVEGIEPGHRGQSFETHVTSCDDVSSCHSSERGLNLDTPPS